MIELEERLLFNSTFECSSLIWMNWLISWSKPTVKGRNQWSALVTHTSWPISILDGHWNQWRISVNSSFHTHNSMTLVYGIGRFKHRHKSIPQDRWNTISFSGDFKKARLEFNLYEKCNVSQPYVFQLDKGNPMGGNVFEWINCQ